MITWNTVVDSIYHGYPRKVNHYIKRDFLWRYASIFPEHALQGFVLTKLTSMQWIYSSGAIIFIIYCGKYYVTYIRCSDTPNRPKQPLDPTTTIIEVSFPCKHNMSSPSWCRTICSQISSKNWSNTLNYIPASLSTTPTFEISGGRPSKLLWQMCALHNVYYHKKSWKMLFKSPKSSGTSRTSLCPLKQCTGTWRKQGWRLLWRQRSHCSPAHRREWMDFAIGSQRLDSGGLETMCMVRWDKNYHLGSMGGDGSGRNLGRTSVTGWWKGLLKFGGGSVMLWGCWCGRGLGMHARLMGGWDWTFCQDSRWRPGG